MDIQYVIDVDTKSDIVHISLLTSSGDIPKPCTAESIRRGRKLLNSPSTQQLLCRPNDWARVVIVDAEGKKVCKQCRRQLKLYYDKIKSLMGDY